MKNRPVIAASAVLLLVGLCVLVAVGPRPDTKDLSYWLRASRSKDWTAEAAQGNPEAQFLKGLTLIRTNLVTMIDRVPFLSSVPVVGRRFEHVTREIDNRIPPEQRAEAYRWIEAAAEKGFAPAIEAKTLFR